MAHLPLPSASASATKCEACGGSVSGCKIYRTDAQYVAWLDSLSERTLNTPDPRFCFAASLVRGS